MPRTQPKPRTDEVAMTFRDKVARAFAESAEPWWISLLVVAGYGCALCMGLLAWGVLA